MTFIAFADPEHIRRERSKAQDLRKSSWWKQQVGQGKCYHCEERFTKDLLTMDHLVPVARGGKSTKNNCVVSCKECNSAKGHKLSVEVKMAEMRESGELAGDDTGSNSGSGFEADTKSDPESNPDTE